MLAMLTAEPKQVPGSESRKPPLHRNGSLDNEQAQARDIFCDIHFGLHCGAQTQLRLQQSRQRPTVQGKLGGCSDCHSMAGKMPWWCFLSLPGFLH
ncbi:hypothetical protein [Bradyrhizobium sp.]|uniref:hypothetical protein n=1 Tax=Bradyrhizobium sp. TaxID=376 RepID=UPI003C71156B